MATALGIINGGLGKIGATICSSIDPPRSPIEKHCATGYPDWRDSELTKDGRRWLFATIKIKLTPNGPPLEDDEKPYPYALPNDCLQPLRNKSTEWEQRGNHIFSAYSDGITLEYIARVPESQWHPAFVEVMKCRVAVECVEFATQSNTKGVNADTRYDRAVQQAARANAFIRGPEDVTLDDDNDTWIVARMGGPLP